MSNSKAKMEGCQAFYQGHVVEDAVKKYPIGSKEFDDWVEGYEEAKKFLPQPGAQQVLPTYDGERCEVTLNFPLGDGSSFGVVLSDAIFWKMVMEVALAKSLYKKD